jgi:hypothetical protein
MSISMNRQTMNVSPAVTKPRTAAAVAVDGRSSPCGHLVSGGVQPQPGGGP